MKKYPYGYWQIKENREIVASECETRVMYSKKYKQSYKISTLNKGEVDEFALKFNWKYQHRSNGYWKIKENREIAASECETRTEYNDKFGAGYTETLQHNGEILEFAIKYNWKSCGNLKNRLIYAFIFEEHKCVYVGLTCNESKRKNQHLTDIYKQTPVYKFIVKNNANYEYKILTIYLPESEACIKEAEYMDYYIGLGYELICDRNKAGQLGGYLKWSYEKREETASKCKTKKEYAKIIGAYAVSCKNKNEIDYFEEKYWIKINQKHNYWKDKNNREIAARECKTRTEYNNKYSSAYNYSRKFKELEYLSNKYNWKSRTKL